MIANWTLCRAGVRIDVPETKRRDTAHHRGRCAAVRPCNLLLANHKKCVYIIYVKFRVIKRVKPAYAKDITPQSLVALVEQNVNVLVTLSSVQTPLTSLATEFSLVLPPPHTPLISHFPARDGPHTIVPIKVPSAGFDAAPARRTTPNILSTNLGTVFFSGVPHALGQNPQLVPILRAPTESFAAEADEGSGDKNADALVDAAERGGEGLWAGGLMGVVTGFQAKNGARTVWAGGVEMFSDEFAVKEVTK